MPDFPHMTLDRTLLDAALVGCQHQLDQLDARMVEIRRQLGTAPEPVSAPALADLPRSPRHRDQGWRVYYFAATDETAELWDVISVSAGVRGCQMLLAPDDLARVVDTRRCDIAAF